MKENERAAELAPSILFLTDFSETSREALVWAETIASDRLANLKVIYPYRLTQLNGRDDVSQLKKKIEVEAQSKFAKLVEGVSKRPASQYDFRAEVGFMNDRVYSYTRRNEVMLVVISTRMANTNREALNEMIDHLQVPLLIVPQNSYPDYQNDDTRTLKLES
jgi:hypothetical protein